MFMTKLKIVTAMLLAVGFIFAGAVGLTHYAVAQQAPATQTVQDQKQTDKKNSEPSNFGGLERRFTGLEAEIAKLTKEVQSLRNQLEAPRVQPDANDDIRLFRLNNAKAAETAMTLKELFQTKNGLGPRIASHATSNTVLVQGSVDLLKTLEAVVAKLDDLD